MHIKTNSSKPLLINYSLKINHIPKRMDLKWAIDLQYQIKCQTSIIGQKILSWHVDNQCFTQKVEMVLLWYIKWVNNQALYYEIFMYWMFP